MGLNAECVDIKSHLYALAKNRLAQPSLKIGDAKELDELPEVDIS